MRPEGALVMYGMWLVVGGFGGEIYGRDICHIYRSKSSMIEYVKQLGTPAFNRLCKWK